MIEDEKYYQIEVGVLGGWEVFDKTNTLKLAEISRNELRKLYHAVRIRLFEITTFD